MKRIHVRNVESVRVPAEALHDAARDLRAEGIVQEDHQRAGRESKLTRVAMHNFDALRTYGSCISQRYLNECLSEIHAHDFLEGVLFGEQQSPALPASQVDNVNCGRSPLACLTTCASVVRKTSGSTG